MPRKPPKQFKMYFPKGCLYQIFEGKEKCTCLVHIFSLEKESKAFLGSSLISPVLPVSSVQFSLTFRVFSESMNRAVEPAIVNIC